jgi:predicted dehydrogenase
MAIHLSRRRFLKEAGALTIATGAGSLWASQAPARRVPIRVAVIGVNHQGNYNMSNVADARDDKTKEPLAEVIALADVDENNAAGARKRFPKARFVTDYRRLFDQKDIEAVVVSTPDHHHALAALPFLRNGKHVYCEKPLTYSVEECRLMMEAAARNKCVTQMGTQIHAGDNYRRVVEIVQSGALGQIRRVHVWCARQPEGGERVRNGTKPPPHLHYDLWLGPAPAIGYPPYRHFGSRRDIHFNWRWWWDYGGGVLADMACHFMDLPHWALNLRTPTTINAVGRVTHKGDNDLPTRLQVDYRYPARTNRPEVHLTWYHGVAGPDLDGKRTIQGFANGVLFEGDKGSLVSDYGNHRLLPEDRFRDFERPKPTIPSSVGHHKEWLRAIRDGGPTTCNFDYSGALTEAVLLGNAVYRAGGKDVRYDAKTGRSNSDAVNARLRRESYRQGWTL